MFVQVLMWKKNEELASVNVVSLSPALPLRADDSRGSLKIIDPRSLISLNTHPRYINGGRMRCSV